MTLNEDLTSIHARIENIDFLEKGTVEKESLFRAQIASLQLELARLKDTRFELKQKRKKAELDKESIERKLELEKQATEIEINLRAKREEIEALIADAPWRDTAFDWQINGAISLPERAICADRRGMGKTLTSIIWRRAQGIKKTLVCLRKEVAYDFMKELNIREPGLVVYPLLGATPQERELSYLLLNHHTEFVVVTNIESWRRDVEGTTEALLRFDWDGVILDEAHHIKSADKATAQGFFKLAEAIPKVLEMTGTPIKNKPQEMFSLLHALYPDIFPRERKFLFDFCVQVAQNRWTFTPHGLKSLVAQISKFYIARSPEDIGRQVPPPRIIEYKLNFENHLLQKKAYKFLTERALAVMNSGKIISIPDQLAIMTRQAQMVSWPAGIVLKEKDEDGNVVEEFKFDIHESVKADWAEELIQELVEEGERVLLFSRFKPAIYELESRLIKAGLSVAVITGDRKHNTEEIFDDFDLKTAPENPKFQVLLATYQTVGESANLNAARHLVLYDRFWNPGNEDQAIGRVDRINSTDQATVHIPLVESSIDEYMTQLIETKKEIILGLKEETNMQASLLEHLRKTV